MGAPRFRNRVLKTTIHSIAVTKLRLTAAPLHFLQSSLPITYFQEAKKLSKIPVSSIL
jgi:hypothetical protein